MNRSLYDFHFISSLPTHSARLNTEPSSPPSYSTTSELLSLLIHLSEHDNVKWRNVIHQHELLNKFKNLFVVYAENFADKGNFVVVVVVVVDDVVGDVDDIFVVFVVVVVVVVFVVDDVDDIFVDVGFYYIFVCSFLSFVQKDRFVVHGNFIVGVVNKIAFYFSSC